MRTTRRRRAAAAAVTAALLAGGAAVVGSQEDAPSAAPPVVAPSPSPTGTPERSDVLPAADGGPAPSAAALAALVDEALAAPALADGLAVSVLDAETGEVLHERAANVPLLPASTAKIATAVAALTALPADLRLPTRVVAGAAPGEVVLVGGGDPTLAGPRAEPGYPQPARLAELARRVREALGTTPVTRVLVDTSLYSGPELAPGWKPSYVSEGAVAPVVSLMVDGGRLRPDRRQRSSEPALAAGRELAALLQPGADVEVARGQAPAGAALLGQVTSPPVPALVERMLTDSDNDLAEALARQVALATGRPASFAGAAEALDEVLGGALEEAGISRDAVRLVDGSGLSREDRLEPGALVRLLARAAAGDDPRLAPVLSGLPVAGFSGTLGPRYREGDAVPAAGVVRAKTGTLNGVSALAGLLRTADGRLLAFDLTADAVPLGANRSAERALDALAARIAACGCP
jgi:D-alanyl-D-alanine carboxypeptidase/D-alanyl-D-alanine-endopeptidase (penicillin-binding protein 4)